MLAEPTDRDRILAEKYPTLFTPQRWNWAGVDATFRTTMPPENQVTNVHVVPFHGDQVILCRERGGAWFLPGGTVEDAETIASCVDRELLEEAGARLTGPAHLVGAHWCVSDQPHPRFAYQSHPRKAWLWQWAEAVICAPPAIPETGGEQVVEVRPMSLREASKLLLTDQVWYPDLLALAAELHATGYF